jgi:hypothetical protein
MDFRKARYCNDFPKLIAILRVLAFYWVYAFSYLSFPSCRVCHKIHHSRGRYQVLEIGCCLRVFERLYRVVDFRVVGDFTAEWTA